MTSRELIKRVIDHKDAPRIGFDFLSPGPCDFTGVRAYNLQNPNHEYSGWARKVFTEEGWR